MTGACGQRGRDAVGQQVWGVEGRRAGRGGDRDQDAEPERASELVGSVDQPGRGAGIEAVRALTGGVAPARAYIEELLPDVLDGTVQPGKVF